MSFKYRFLRKNAVSKILIDIGIILIISFLVFGVLPTKVTFMNLAAVHSSFLRIVVYVALAILLIIGSRLILKAYKQPWNFTDTLQYLMIIVADSMAGVVYYFVTEFWLDAAYPFLLEVVLFALIDIATLFVRLLYRSLNERMDFMEQ